MLLDTSGLLALLDDSEARHSRAKLLYIRARRRVVHSYVLAELVPLADSRRFSRRRTLDFVAGVQLDTDVELVWVDESLHTRALDLLRARLDKTYSLCDAVSFVLMRDQGLTAALTTDRHFEQEGFERLLV